MVLGNTQRKHSKNHIQGLVFDKRASRQLCVLLCVHVFTMNRYRLHDFHTELQLSRYQKQSGKCILVTDEAISFRVNFSLLILL